MIEMRDLEFAIGKARILHGVGADMEDGCLTALIGPNGAGKSSLLHCISGLHPINAGHIRIDGQDPLDMPDRARARLVALLQQKTHIVPRLTVRELVSFGRWPHHGGRPGVEDKRIVEAALDVFDLGELAGRTLDTLSGGQHQRAMVAMIWAQSTPWLLLDEPLNALDPRYARDLMKRLHDLTRPGPGQRSVVVVLHDINAAAGWADRVVAMKDGQIYAQGPCDEVLVPETLGAIYDTPFEVIRHDGKPVVIAR